MKPILRPYQQEIVNEILAKFDQSPTVVLAASPNAGKTECGIYITTEFLEKATKSPTNLRYQSKNLATYKPSREAGKGVSGNTSEERLQGSHSLCELV